MKTIKRTLAVLLTLLMLIGAVPLGVMNVSAEDLEYAMFPFNELKISRTNLKLDPDQKENAMQNGGHYNYYAWDLIGSDKDVKAPFTGTIVYIDKSNSGNHMVILQSKNKVKLANGTEQYLSALFLHDSNISDLKKGQEIKQGQVFYQQGKFGNATGVHLHIEIATGKRDSLSSIRSNGIQLNDALFLSKKTKRTKDFIIVYTQNNRKIKLNWRIAPEPNIVATPVISNPTDIIGGAQITLTCTTSGAIIYYTTNGSNPTTSSTKYTKPFTLTSTKTVKAIAVKSGMSNSAIASKTITVNPVATPTVSFAVTNAGFKTTITTATAGAKIYYTTDGTNPTTASMPYNANEGFNMGAEGTVKAFAVKPGMANSAFAERSTPGVEIPSAPSIERDASTPATIGIGDAISLKWNAVQHAFQYVLTVERDGEPVAFRAEEPVNQLETQETTTSFVAEAAGVYTITAKAENFLGESADQTSVSVTVKPDVTVTFKNYDNSVLSQQSIHWGGSAVAPTPPEREGYTFKAWSGTYTNVKTDSEVVATYTPKTYAVVFEDENGIQLSKIIADYDSSVTPPTPPVKTGYDFVGWSVKSGEGDSYEKVNGAVTFKPIYVWSNPDMPLGVSIDSALRSADAKSYEVHAKVTNNTSNVLNAKMISVIKTENDKVVATEIDAITVPANASEKAYNTTISGTNDAMHCEVYLVANDPENANRTGGAYSEKATKEVTREASNTYTYWSDWSDWSTTPVAASDTVEVDEVKMYQYRDKITTTNASSSLPGWESAGSNTTYGNWSSWSGWKWQSDTASDTVKVESKQFYYYWHFCIDSYTLYPAQSFNSKATLHELFKENTSANNWNKDRKSTDDSRYWMCDNHDKCSKGQKTWYYGGLKTRYRSQTRTKTVTYNYWKWGEYSDWSKTPVISSDSREVIEQMFYRCRTLQTETTVNNTIYSVTENLSGTEYHVSGALHNVNADYSGKTAIVMVYKDRNTDPTENQIEYIGSIKLGVNNSYDFSFIPREELSVTTGNYIVSFGIATTNGLVNNVEMIEAPKPEYKVDFQDEEGNILSSQTVVKGEDAVIPEVPDVEGNDIRWNRTNTNINSDTIIKAEPLPKTYSVIFVDWANNRIVDTQEAVYGSEIQFPADCSATGKTFVGWSVPAGSTVTGTMIIESVYEDILFDVIFLNQNGTVYDTQKVPYGSSVLLPEENPTAEGYEFLAWSNNAKWWNVTENLTVEPVFVYDKTAETPIYTPHEENDIVIDEDIIIFDAPSDGSSIYVTTDGSDPTEEDMLLEDNIFIANKSMRLKARAFKADANPSDIVEVIVDIYPESSVPTVTADTTSEQYEIGDDYANLFMKVNNPQGFTIQAYGFTLCNVDTEDMQSYENNNLNGLNRTAFGVRFPLQGLEAGTYTYNFYVMIEGLGILESNTESFTIGTPVPHVHTYDDGIITQQPSCFEDGVMTYTCTTCDAETEGHTKTEIIPAFGEHAAPDEHGDCERCGTHLIDVCAWCGGQHEGFFQGIIGFFHRIFAALFGAKY